MIKKIIIVSVALTLISCATSYQPNSFSGGFEEIQLSPNVWSVTFNGNGYTRATAAEEMALLRSAELTLTNGFKYFAIVDRNSRNDTTVIPQASRSYTSGNINSFGNYNGRTTTYGGVPLVIKKPSANNTIMMFKENLNDDPFFYDANFICESLGPKYEVICGQGKD
ncbi:CC0125/CC1285 family lipoprotein [Pseudidiomarina mangrovi]|uniref:CC0125/CC1285 family lipoprotein n=1 Tax=Pseudidiomarina mangrovi TaxID=2487133 RepID=UPI00196A2030|nr:hypothetical protein [Pseudidiomarina mangrovi]